MPINTPINQVSRTIADKSAMLTGLAQPGHLRRGGLPLRPWPAPLGRGETSLAGDRPFLDKRAQHDVDGPSWAPARRRAPEEEEEEEEERIPRQASEKAGDRRWRNTTLRRGGVRASSDVL